MVFIITGTGVRTAESFNGTFAPVLTSTTPESGLPTAALPVGTRLAILLALKVGEC